MRKRDAETVSGLNDAAERLLVEVGRTLAAHGRRVDELIRAVEHLLATGHRTGSSPGCSDCILAAIALATAKQARARERA